MSLESLLTALQKNKEQVLTTMRSKDALLRDIALLTRTAPPVSPEDVSPPKDMISDLRADDYVRSPDHFMKAGQVVRVSSSDGTRLTVSEFLKDGGSQNKTIMLNDLIKMKSPSEIVQHHLDGGIVSNEEKEFFNIAFRQNFSRVASYINLDYGYKSESLDSDSKDMVFNFNWSNDDRFAVKISINYYCGISIFYNIFIDKQKSVYFSDVRVSQNTENINCPPFVNSNFQGYQKEYGELVLTSKSKVEMVTGTQQSILMNGDLYQGIPISLIWYGAVKSSGNEDMMKNEEYLNHGKYKTFFSNYIKEFYPKYHDQLTFKVMTPKFGSNKKLVITPETEEAKKDVWEKMFLPVKEWNNDAFNQFEINFFGKTQTFVQREEAPRLERKFKEFIENDLKYVQDSKETKTYADVIKESVLFESLIGVGYELVDIESSKPTLIDKDLKEKITITFKSSTDIIFIAFKQNKKSDGYVVSVRSREFNIIESFYKRDSNYLTLEEFKSRLKFIWIELNEGRVFEKQDTFAKWMDSNITDKIKVGNHFRYILNSVNEIMSMSNFTGFKDYMGYVEQIKSLKIEAISHKSSKEYSQGWVKAESLNDSELTNYEMVAVYDSIKKEEAIKNKILVHIKSFVREYPVEVQEIISTKSIFKPSSSTIDFGRLRGQGRRSGGGIMGSMRDSTLQGEKNYSDPLGNVPNLSEDDYLVMQNDDYLTNAFLGARSDGYSNFFSIVLALMAKDAGIILTEPTIVEDPIIEEPIIEQGLRLVQPLPPLEQQNIARERRSRTIKKSTCAYLRKSLKEMLPKHIKVRVKTIDSGSLSGTCSVACDTETAGDSMAIFKAIRELGFQNYMIESMSSVFLGIEYYRVETYWNKKKSDPQERSKQVYVIPMEYDQYTEEAILVDFDAVLAEFKDSPDLYRGKKPEAEPAKQALIPFNKWHSHESVVNQEGTSIWLAFSNAKQSGQLVISHKNMIKPVSMNDIDNDNISILAFRDPILSGDWVYTPISKDTKTFEELILNGIGVLLNLAKMGLIYFDETFAHEALSETLPSNTSFGFTQFQKEVVPEPTQKRKTKKPTNFDLFELNDFEEKEAELKVNLFGFKYRDQLHPVFDSNNVEYSVVYELMRVDSYGNKGIQISNLPPDFAVNIDYPSAFQTRNLATPKEMNKIRGIALYLNAIQLMSSNVLTIGCPIVYIDDNKAFVLGGNGRSIALATTSKDNYIKYLKVLRREFPELFDLNADRIQSMFEASKGSARTILVRSVYDKDGDKLDIDTAEKVAGASQGSTSAEETPLRRSVSNIRSLGLMKIPMRDIPLLDVPMIISVKSLPTFLKKNVVFWMWLKSKLPPMKQRQVQYQDSTTIPMIYSIIASFFVAKYLPKSILDEGFISKSQEESLIYVLPLLVAIAQEIEKGVIRKEYNILPHLEEAKKFATETEDLTYKATLENYKTECDEDRAMLFSREEVVAEWCNLPLLGAGFAMYLKRLMKVHNKEPVVNTLIQYYEEAMKDRNFEEEQKTGGLMDQFTSTGSVKERTSAETLKMAGALFLKLCLPKTLSEGLHEIENDNKTDDDDDDNQNGLF